MEYADRRLRTTDGLERLHEEIERTTRVTSLFPNEAFLLRLASAVLCEMSDDREAERACPTSMFSQGRSVSRARLILLMLRQFAI